MLESRTQLRRNLVSQTYLKLPNISPIAAKPKVWAKHTEVRQLVDQPVMEELRREDRRVVN